MRRYGTCDCCGRQFRAGARGRVAHTCSTCRNGRIVRLSIMPTRGSIRTWECPQCNARFATATNLHAHLTTEHGAGHMRMVNLYMPPVLIDWIDSRVDGGEFPSRSEAIRAMLHAYRVVTQKTDTEGDD